MRNDAAAIASAKVPDAAVPLWRRVRRRLLPLFAIAVLAYRALYYLVPLAGGLVIYLLLESYAASHPAPDRPEAGGGSG